MTTKIVVQVEIGEKNLRKIRRRQELSRDINCHNLQAGEWLREWNEINNALASLLIAAAEINEVAENGRS
jgi:hypothetical protein